MPQEKWPWPYYPTWKKKPQTRRMNVSLLVCSALYGLEKIYVSKAALTLVCYDSRYKTIGGSSQVETWIEMWKNQQE